jgi:predicted lactoylglutathione lyase
MVLTSPPGGALLTLGGTMSQSIYLNLPVRDLNAAVRFYKAIGCRKNPDFSSDDSAAMIWSDTIVFQLLTHDYFLSFSNKPIASPATNEMLIALSFGERDAVDQVCDAAVSAGGQTNLREPQDMGFMYVRTFQDLDGHVFEPMWMDPAGLPASEAQNAG